MAEKIVRLEDIIKLAQAGNRIEGEVNQARITATCKVHPEAEIVEEKEAYFLKAMFRFKLADQVYRVEKVYVMGFSDEDLDTTRLNKNIANSRLKEDFRRLKEAGVISKRDILNNVLAALLKGKWPPTGRLWLRGQDSNLDTGIQSPMSYQLDDPGSL